MTETASPVRVGLTLPSFQSDPERVLAMARAAEDAGLDGVFLFDHLFRQRGDVAGAERRPALELMTMTAAVAAATRRVAVGTLVARATLRPPATTRAAFDTIARLAPGRIIAGLGAGDDDSIAEDSAFGVLPADPEPAGTDPAGTEPAGTEPAGTEPAGTEPAGTEPAGTEPAGTEPAGTEPAGTESAGVDRSSRRDLGAYRLERLEATVQALVGCDYPVWLAGRSTAALRLAAATADGWNHWGSDPPAFAAAAARLREQVWSRQDADTFTYTWGGLAVLAPTPAAAQEKWERLGGNRPGIIWGDPRQVADQIAAYAAAGADWVILGPIDSANPDNAALLGDARRLLPPAAP